MRKKTKIAFFIGAVFLLLVIILLAPYGLRVNLAAIGGTALAALGAAFAGFSGRGRVNVDPRADADKRALELERENRAAAGSMDSVSRDGEGIRAEGERLVDVGDRLVGESKSLIDELRKRDAGANKGA